MWDMNGNPTAPRLLTLAVALVAHSIPSLAQGPPSAGEGKRSFPTRAPARADVGSEDGQDEPAKERRQRSRSPRGLRVDSTVRFLDDTMTPLHRLVCTWIGQDRQRFDLIAGGGAETRLILTHFEGRVYRRTGPGNPAPALEGKNREGELRALALRRAAVDFPAGLEWKDVEGHLKAEVPGAGSLIVQLDAKGRPNRVRSFDPEGVEYEGFDTFEWGDEPWPMAPQVPHSLRLTFRDRGIWTERIDAVEVRIAFVDDYFLPPDQRRSAPQELDGELRSRSVDLAPAWELAAPLRGRGWDAVRAEVNELHRRTATQLGRRAVNLLPFRYVRLDGEGRPTHALVRIRGVLDPVPEGWETLKGGIGIECPIPESSLLTGGTLRTLASRGPKGSTATSATLQIQPEPKEGASFGLLSLRLELEDGAPAPDPDPDPEEDGDGGRR